ncbi:LVIVD repeat-containing protein [Actinokineospora alba]|uniref:LVIVD repeat-containing protein n=1 Tax=Actinokineospora alba TaxID=504798 RepID=A0A1H0TQB9_9PSEU|nr:LVIVD repeat-containing protein [Actinokineospora alba]SDJ12344.1 LVIVD repeat-containing protein [Actinokineospora alba]SDP55920.1 LVIVD repeat-containing protein [Actinokineospora alba]
MKSIHFSKRSRRAALALLGVAAAGLSVVGGPSAAAQDFPADDEIVTSANVSHLVNVPPTGPLSGPSSVGTDLAFSGDHAIVGNYLGFTIYDIKNPKKPTITSQVLCPGAQNDISVSGNLVFLSTDSRRTDDSCNSASQSDPEKYWEGMKIFDISDKANPKYVAAVATDCGSHTHTLVPDKRGKDVYLYVSSYGPSAALAKCKPPHDKITIIKVPIKNPSAAAIVATPVLFPNGGSPGKPGTVETGYVVPTSGCHDITVFPAKNLAAGACMGEGVLMDISDREKPRVFNTVRDDDHFAFWHSATFNNDGTKVVFTDELGGGGAATCNAKIGPTRGANGIYDITGRGDERKLEFRSFFKIDRHQTDEENCVAHNGSLIPVPGKDIMVQAWYMGGVQVFDFTDSRAPKQIGFFERGPAADPNTGGGVWSSYYYNGYIYASDIGKGFDVIEINDPATNVARGHKWTELNVQTQYGYGR